MGALTAWAGASTYLEVVIALREVKRPAVGQDRREVLLRSVAVFRERPSAFAAYY